MTDTPELNDFESTYNLKIVPGKDYYIREKHWLPRKLGIRYLAFGKFLYSDREVSSIPDHEFFHIAQFNRYGIPRVIAHYLFNFTKNYFSCFDLARSFVNIPFEVEARDYEMKQKEIC